MSTTPIPTPKEARPKMSTVLEQLRKLDEQRTKLVEDAKTAALKKAEEAVAELNELGFDYRLTEGATAPKKNTGGGSVRRRAEICPICQFGTEPRHDGRHKAHKAQDTKKALTEKQLAEFGLKKK